VFEYNFALHTTGHIIYVCSYDTSIMELINFDQGWQYVKKIVLKHQQIIDGVSSFLDLVFKVCMIYMYILWSKMISLLYFKHNLYALCSPIYKAQSNQRGFWNAPTNPEVKAQCLTISCKFHTLSIYMYGCSVKL
jgi:hypothetical protein